MNIIYGEVTSESDTDDGACTTHYTDTVGFKYNVAGHACKDVMNVYQKDYDGTVVKLTGGGVDYAWSNVAFDGDYICEIDMVVDQSDYIITCDVQGVETAGDGTGTLYTDPIDELEHFITTWLNTNSIYINDTSFAAAKVITLARSWTFGGMIEGVITGKNIVNQMCNEMLASYFFNTNGEFCLDIFSLSDTKTGLTNYDDQDDVLRNSLRIEPEVDGLANKIKYWFKYNYPNYEYDGYDDIEDSASITSMGQTFPLDWEMNWVRDPTVAASIAGWRLKETKYPFSKPQFKTKLHMLLNDLNDRITLTHYAGLSLPGYSTETLKIKELNIDLDELNVEVVAQDEEQIYDNV